MRPSLVLRRPGEQRRSYYQLSHKTWLVEAVRELLERASTTRAEEDVEEGIVETLARVFERVTIDLRVDEKNAIDAACDALVVYAQTVSVRFRPKQKKSCEADIHAAPERHQAAKRGRVHL